MWISLKTYPVWHQWERVLSIEVCGFHAVKHSDIKKFCYDSGDYSNLNVDFNNAQPALLDLHPGSSVEALWTSFRNLILGLTAKWSLKANVSKCSLLTIGRCFSREYFITDSDDVVQALPRVKSVSDLDVVMDDRLQIKEHVLSKIKKSNSMSNICKVAGTKNQFSERKKKKWVDIDFRYQLPAANVSNIGLALKLFEHNPFVNINKTNIIKY
ncbi:hypothetical protein HELRODRAFT_160155 [Helobdella robusta]|uniref:Uncharacterized protein n=1 Tax=Helobdella robusta TaxID=6412 RepID=T1EPW5_HELRO|nr:hypothetical protein HELRODRAFT_160155 [Helobdella robusta]ESO06040.1 hypothetical protein HELRODRAFT_160155 [Helobdella robusta]